MLQLEKNWQKTLTHHYLLNLDIYFSHPQLTGYFFRMYTRCFPYHWLLVCTLPKRYMSEIYNLAAHHKFDAALNQLLLPSVLMLLWKKYVQFFLFYTL